MTVLDCLHVEDVVERFTLLPLLPITGRYVFVGDCSLFFEQAMGPDWQVQMHAPHMKEWWHPVFEELKNHPYRAYEVELLCRYRHGPLDHKTTDDLLGVFRTETVVLTGSTTEMDLDFAQEGEGFVMVNLTEYGADENRVLVATLLGMKLEPFLEK